MQDKRDKILFVEDNKVDRMAFERFARREDFLYDYITAGSVKEVRKIIQSEKFDAAVIDYLLGDGTAFDLFDKIKDTPIIIVTGAGSEEIAVRAMKSGAYDYLIKDSEGNYLKTMPAILEKAIDHKRIEDELKKYQQNLEELVKERTAELQAEIHERKRAEEQIKASLAEKEVLLREIHHRVGNNMQVISSLLSIQAKAVSDTRYSEIIKSSQKRIFAMSLVYDNLYRSRNLENINFGEYMKSLASTLFQGYSLAGRVALNMDVEYVSLPIDYAIPCGLILNELVSNSLKHAFPGDKEGEIRIALTDNDGNITFIVSNNGVEFPKDLDFRNTESLGLQLVIDLVGQIDGTIELDGSEGTAFEITFQIKE